jgi:hypothetical protein
MPPAPDSLPPEGLQADPDPALTATRAGIELLQAGLYRQGWPLFEQRLLRRQIRGEYTHWLRCPRWTGEVVEHLCVVLEQGLGDRIWALRWLPQARAMTRRLTIVLPKGLQGIITTALGVEVDEWIMPDAPIRITAATRWIPSMSLPAVLGVDSPADVNGRPYLRAPDGPRVAGIGVCFFGASDFERDVERSLPPSIANTFSRAIAETSGEDVIGLHGPEHRGKAGLSMEAASTDLLMLARFVAGLSLVISVDTFIAHLAGALGVPVWLLTYVPPDWRWGLPGPDCPWYQSMRIFRQPEPAHWRPVYEELIQALATRRDGRP